MSLNWNKNSQATTETWFAYGKGNFIYHIEYDSNSATFKSCLCLFNTILGTSNGWSSVEAAQNHWEQHNFNL